MNVNFNDICRLCLRLCEKYVELDPTNGVKPLTNDLVEKIKYCYVVEIDFSGELPTKICHECIQVLSFFYTAKKNVFISEQLLRDVVFVRKKLQEEMKNDEITSTNVIEIKEKHEEIKSAITPKNSELKKSEQNSVKIIDVEIQCNEQHVNNSHNSEKIKPTVVTPKMNELETTQRNRVTAIDMELNCSTSCNSTSPISAIPMIDVETGKTISDTNECHFSMLQGCNSKENDSNNMIQGKKKKVEPKNQGNNGLSKLPNNNLDIFLSLMDIAKRQHRQAKKPKNMTGGSRKTVLGINVPSIEIGSKIDGGNILSPHIKRSRRV